MLFKNSLFEKILEKENNNSNIRDAWEFAEIGYKKENPDLPILFGNWNADYSGDKTVPTRMSRIRDIAEKLGYTVEYEDEWATCSECNRAVRTSQNSYGWRPYYSVVRGELLCADCIKKDPEDYLEELEQNHRNAVTFDLDLEKHGYKQVNGLFDHGFHSGMDADPKVILNSLEKLGIRRVIFNLDGTGQFHLTFSVWVHESEWKEDLADQMCKLGTNGPSVSAALERALTKAPLAGEGVTHIDEGAASVTIYKGHEACSALLSK